MVRAVRPPDQARDDPAPGREPAARLPGDGAARRVLAAGTAAIACFNLPSRRRIVLSSSTLSLAFSATVHASLLGEGFLRPSAR